jgi:membrane-anchored glycerophosphoryl diester phosphodiesterase (GDPDase)
MEMEHKSITFSLKRNKKNFFFFLLSVFIIINKMVFIFFGAGSPFIVGYIGLTKSQILEKYSPAIVSQI